MRQLANGLRILFLMRYAVLSAIAIPALAAIGYFGKSSILANLFVLDDTRQLFHLTWLSLLAVSIAFLSARVTQLNAPRRFRDCGDESGAPPLQAYEFLMLPIWMLMGLATPLICIRSTAIGSRGTSDWVHDPFVLPGCLAIAGGFFLAIVMHFLFAVFCRYALREELIFPLLVPYPPSFPLKQGHGAAGALFARPFLIWTGSVKGYVIPGDPPRLGPGHLQAMFCLSLALIAYIVAFRVVGPNEASFPTLFFALLILIVFCSLFSGASFFLDYYRIPTTLSVIAFSVVTSALWRTDHFYELLPREGYVGEKDPQTVSPDEGPFLAQIFDRWPCHASRRDGKRTLVVVTAAGGGIQASAWTSRVLTGLHERYGEKFTQSVGLVSSVSGGSVGAMYFFSLRDQLKGAGDDAKEIKAVTQRINQAARKSALEATGWGMAFPDLVRLAVPVLPRDLLVDRGWAVEQVWRDELQRIAKGRQADWTLRELVPLIQSHELPVPVFNATLVESGQRFLISPVKFLENDGPHVRHPRLRYEAEEFLGLYEKSDVRVSTAVRLSATFSYIAPICGPLQGEDRLPGDRLGDGGYSDDEGIVTAVQAMSDLIDRFEDVPYDRRPFHRILLVRIQAFPDPQAGLPAPATNGGTDGTLASEGQVLSKTLPQPDSSGWFYAALGPLCAMFQVRIASQAERGDLTLYLLEGAANAALMNSRQVDDHGRARPAAVSAVKASQMIQGWHRQHALSDQRMTRRATAGPIEDEDSTSDRAGTKRSAPVPPIEVASVKLSFTPDGNLVIPLSWKLTRQQWKAIDRNWKNLDALDSESNPFKKGLFYDTRSVSAGADPVPTLSLDDIFDRTRE